MAIVSLPNPKHAPPPILAGRNTNSDLAALNAIIAAYPTNVENVPMHDLCTQWRATLSKAEIDSIQASYPFGLGDYVQKVLHDAGLV